MADLVAPRHLRHGDPVVPGRDLVGRIRQREHGLRDPPREIPAERAGDEDPREERRQQPPGERQPALVQARGRSRQDDRAEDLVAELDRPRESKQTGLVDGASELELKGVPREDPPEVENRPGQQRVRGRRAREEVDSLSPANVEDLVARRTLEVD